MISIDIDICLNRQKSTMKGVSHHITVRNTKVIDKAKHWKLILLKEALAIKARPLSSITGSKPTKKELVIFTQCKLTAMSGFQHEEINCSVSFVSSAQFFGVCENVYMALTKYFVIYIHDDGFS